MEGGPRRTRKAQGLLMEECLLIAPNTLVTKTTAVVSSVLEDILRQRLDELPGCQQLISPLGLESHGSSLSCFQYRTEVGQVEGVTEST